MAKQEKMLDTKIDDPQFPPQDPHEGRKEPIARNYPLTSTCM